MLLVLCSFNEYRIITVRQRIRTQEDGELFSAPEKARFTLNILVFGKVSAPRSGDRPAPVFDNIYYLRIPQTILIGYDSTRWLIHNTYTYILSLELRSTGIRKPRKKCAQSAGLVNIHHVVQN